MPSVYLFFTKENPTFALVLYKRHRNSWRQYKWMLETDELVKGQWISKPVRIKDAFLHPSGEYFYYTYYTYIPGKWDCRCGVVSRPLNFTAIKTDNKILSSFSCESTSYFSPPPLFDHLFKSEESHLVLQSTFEYDSWRRGEFYLACSKHTYLSPREKYQWIDPRGRKVTIHLIGKQLHPVIMVNSQPLFEFSTETFEPVNPV